jgi:hypothetical protein
VTRLIKANILVFSAGAGRHRTCGSLKFKEVMTDARTKAADLAAIKARWELNYAVANHPMFAGNPLVAAALANAKANDAAFLAALAEVEAERNFFRMWKTHRHFRQACAAADRGHATLREVIGNAEDEYNRRKA